jgi:hypothetical protein
METRTDVMPAKSFPPSGKPSGRPRQIAHSVSIQRWTAACAGKAHRKDKTMAIPWLMALKVIPWRDVIEHAPSVLKAARKLMDRQPPQPPGQAGSPATTTPFSAVPSLGELKNALIAAQGQIDSQAQTQRELTETLAQLAEQNARLVSAVEVLRLRTRVLVWGGAAMLVWLAVLTW